MKKIIFVLLLALSSCSIQQRFVQIEPISQSFEVEGTRNDLFVKANNWMVETFNNAESVIQFSDKESGSVTGKYLLKKSVVYDGYKADDASIFAIIKLQTKDGAARITIDPDDFNEVNSTLVKKELWYTEETTRQQVADLISSYENYLKNDTSTEW